MKKLRKNADEEVEEKQITLWRKPTVKGRHGRRPREWREGKVTRGKHKT